MIQVYAKRVMRKEMYFNCMICVTCIVMFMVQITLVQYVTDDDQRRSGNGDVDIDVAPSADCIFQFTGKPKSGMLTVW